MPAPSENPAQSVFNYDCAAEVDKTSTRIKQLLRTRLRRRGLVVAISGGIDSSVCAALSVAAIGRDKVFGLLLPETDSSSNSLERGKQLAEHLGIKYEVKNITGALEALGCYQWRDDAIRSIFPDYGPAWKNKIAISGASEGQFNHFRLIVENPQGEQFAQRLDARAYLQLVAATNFKQRVRKNLEYFHADRLNYAVVGTPNRMEYDQGFFVKNGDGAADLKPIAHLYKTQVYMLARHLDLPEAICSAIPTTDTYSLSQGQDEFYYGLPYQQMDLALWHLNQGKPAADLAAALAISEAQAEAIYRDIEHKRSTTAPLHWPALLLEPVSGPQTIA
jgi:NAD+ synthase